MKPKYVGITRAKHRCYDCDRVGIMKIYETPDGILYLCFSCSNEMVYDYDEEAKESHYKRQPVERED